MKTKEHLPRAARGTGLAHRTCRVRAGGPQCKLKTRNHRSEVSVRGARPNPPSHVHPRPQPGKSRWTSPDSTERRATASVHAPDRSVPFRAITGIEKLPIRLSRGKAHRTMAQVRKVRMRGDQWPSGIGAGCSIHMIDLEPARPVGERPVGSVQLIDFARRGSFDGNVIWSVCRIPRDEACR